MIEALFFFEQKPLRGLPSGRQLLLVVLLAVGAIVVDCRSAQADGGKLQASERAGPWIVSLFTSPTPLRVGLVDVSVLVQRAETKETVADASIEIIARKAGSNFETRQVATRQAATNQLFQAAWLEMPSAGEWTITALVKGEGETAELSLEVWVSSAPPPWSDLAIWVVWPVLPIALYAGALRGVSARKYWANDSDKRGRPL